MKPRRRWFRFAFSLRTLLVVVTVAAIPALWLRSWMRPQQHWLNPIDRSWIEGGVTLKPYKGGKEVGIVVESDWPNASPDLRMRYLIWLLQDGRPDRFVMANGQSGASLKQANLELLLHEYLNVPGFDPSMPHRFAVDYEIWEGKPDDGVLLAKQSVISEPIRPATH